MTIESHVSHALKHNTPVPSTPVDRPFTDGRNPVRKHMADLVGTRLRTNVEESRDTRKVRAEYNRTNDPTGSTRHNLDMGHRAIGRQTRELGLACAYLRTQPYRNVEATRSSAAGADTHFDAILFAASRVVFAQYKAHAIPVTEADVLSALREWVAVPETAERKARREKAIADGNEARKARYEASKASYTRP